MLWIQTATDLDTAARLIPRRRHGIICVDAGAFQSLVFRPWPKVISRLEITTLGRWGHFGREGDRCRLFYNFPLSSPGFLSLAYIESNRQTQWETVRKSLELLDWVAENRGAHASVCELSNARISDRLMGRLGWEPHCQHLHGRHFIKRFYGEFPRHAWLPEVQPWRRAQNLKRPVKGESPGLSTTFSDCSP